jgi:hypothetical protein
MGRESIVVGLHGRQPQRRVGARWVCKHRERNLHRFHGQSLKAAAAQFGRCKLGTWEGNTVLLHCPCRDRRTPDATDSLGEKGPSLRGQCAFLSCSVPLHALTLRSQPRFVCAGPLYHFLLTPHPTAAPPVVFAPSVILGLLQWLGLYSFLCYILLLCYWRN